MQRRWQRFSLLLAVCCLLVGVMTYMIGYVDGYDDSQYAAQQRIKLACTISDAQRDALQLASTQIDQCNVMHALYRNHIDALIEAYFNEKGVVVMIDRDMPDLSGVEALGVGGGEND